jgi:hypothetical protein
MRSSCAHAGATPRANCRCVSMNKLCLLGYMGARSLRSVFLPSSFFRRRCRAVWARRRLRLPREPIARTAIDTGGQKSCSLPPGGVEVLAARRARGAPDHDHATRDLRAQRERIGRPIGLADAWIAATALWYDVPLVTHDRDMEGIPGLQVLTLHGGWLVCDPRSGIHDHYLTRTLRDRAAAHSVSPIEH